MNIKYLSGGTSVNNLGIDVNGYVVVGTTGGGTFTGGTVTGPTRFTNGLTANTFSATTYQNLPLDVRVTGGTYTSGSATFTNNTGGTFSVTGFTLPYTFTGGTVSGATTFTGGLSANTLSATTITTPSIVVNATGLRANTLSATTYLNLPTDIRVTGGTYSSGSATFTNNTGGTFSVSGFSTVGAFTGTTTLNFGSPISGESSCATTTVANTNINQFSTVMVRFTSSVNHPDVNDSIIEELTVNQSDIIDGVSFNINAYACGGTWGVYNVIYRIIN
jgi:hypothetical protein